MGTLIVICIPASQLGYSPQAPKKIPAMQLQLHGFGNLLVALKIY
jgi:hypothetical protein